MVAGANKVFCGTENGVCELTKDTVYVHPSAKQCNWTPNMNSVFSPVITFGSGEYIKFTLNNITSIGMYYLNWKFQLTSSDYGDNSLVARLGSSNSKYITIHGTSIPNDIGSTVIITSWINVTYVSSYNFGMVVDGVELSTSISNKIFDSITLTIGKVGSPYNGNSYNTIKATLYRLKPS